MIAMPVAENQPVEPLGLDAEQVEIARQDLGGVSKIEQVLPGRAAGSGLEMLRQAPFASQRRVQITVDATDMLDRAHRVRRLRHKLVENRIYDHAHR
jgi:hypothetical protein